MKTRRAAFLFGSGISRASGGLTLDCITKYLLFGPWKPHTSGRFCPCEPAAGSKSVGDAERAQQFLWILKGFVDPHLLSREGRLSDYEDLFSASHQILQHETLEVPNPLIANSLDSIKKATEPLHQGHKSDIDNNPFASLVERATDLIQWAVYFGLEKASTPVGLDVIAETAKEADELDIFTLNHDRLIETQLNQESIIPKDGFSKQIGDARTFNWSWQDPDARVRLLKLHGSIGWYRIAFDGWDQFAVVSDPDHCRDEGGRLLMPGDLKPMFLTGTTVKEQAYGTGLFGEVFREFLRLLSIHRTLVCCGYGWGDKGINIRLRQWLKDARENRLVILHEGQVSELRDMLFWRRDWDDLTAGGKVLVVSKWLSQCSLGDLAPYFDDYQETRPEMCRTPR